MNKYEKEQIKKLKKWKKKVTKKPFIIDKVSKNTQNKINSMLPDKYHEVMTLAIKNMTKMVLVGSNYTNIKPIKDMSLEERDKDILERIRNEIGSERPLEFLDYSNKKRYSWGIFRDRRPDLYEAINHLAYKPKNNK